MDRAFPRTAFVGGGEVGRVFVAGQEAEFVFGRGTQILPTLGAEIYARTEARMTDDTEGYWFEFGFKMDAVLSGNSAAGFTDGGNYFRLDLEQSTDLQTWSLGKFVPAPTGAVVNNGDGTYTYWSRSTVPAWWYDVICDLTLTCDAYGKSITEISVGNAPVSLAYPFAMPSQAAALQTALRAAGYTGATVSSISKPLVAQARNYTVDGAKALYLDMSGTNVVMARDGYGTNITAGMSYPYSMPSQKAALQTALRAAGHSGAVVKLYGDEWTITLPNRPAANTAARQFSLTYTPEDPHPSWDMFGNYQGLSPDNVASGTFTNVRNAGSGAPIPEANRQFGRLRISRGTRYDPFIP